jgi:hypothetical protein
MFFGCMCTKVKVQIQNFLIKRVPVLVPFYDEAIGKVVYSRMYYFHHHILENDRKTLILKCELILKRMKITYSST